MTVSFLSPTIPVYTFVGQRPGPTAIVQAGIHGDEIAGVHALQEWLEEGIRIEAGKLVVIPVMNPAAYRARERAAPGGLDLNRCFPGDPSAPERERRLAAQLLDLIRAERPALVATLHESKKRYDPEIKPSFGQTLVYGVEPCPEIFTRVVERLNARASLEERWVTQYYPVATSSTEVIVDAVGCLGTCVETWMGFPERRRIAMQREVVDLLLADLGIV
ncbi:MAG: succinylglutamate desuccinylase/aspartoacylase family protein [Deltaproteobacteria bacterium]|nr:succinylglutamate desuccinylase/aspartoacylase family protein [Deltaproteobacteria bacterium]